MPNGASPIKLIEIQMLVNKKITVEMFSFIVQLFNNYKPKIFS